MFSKIAFLTFTSSALLTSAAPTPPEDVSTSYQLTSLYPNLKKAKPLQMLVTNKGERLLLQQRGVVSILPADEQAAEATTFLDMQDRKMIESESSSFEEGVVGMILHPKFAENHLFYIYYTQQAPKHAVLSEMKATVGEGQGNLKADMTSERVLLNIPLPWWFHHSGSMVFGKDGMLYLAIGDGGGPLGDQLRLAQNTFCYNGKILRLDVNTKTGNRPYGLPKDNPWLNKPGFHPEPVALGLRNPWGMCLDPEGTIWFADVGQTIAEEVNLLEIGGNYGWSFREGTGNFMGRTDTPPEGTKFVEPIHIYGRDQGISITGGVIYTGKALPKLSGAYIFGDWGSGRIWSLRYDKTAKQVTSHQLIVAPTPSGGKDSAPVKPTGFSVDENGEIIVLDWGGGVYRITGTGKEK